MLGDLAKKESVDDLILAKLIGELPDAVKNKLAGKKIDLGAAMGELAKDSLAKKAIAIRRGQSVEVKKDVVAATVVHPEKTEVHQKDRVRGAKTCFNCKEDGHYTEVLSKREYTQRDLRPITMGVTTWEGMAPMDWDMASMIFKAIAFGPLIFTALVDSGSEINVLPAEEKEKFQRMNVPVEDLNVTIKGAGKTKAIGKAEIQLTCVETTKSVFTDVFFGRGVEAVVTSVEDGTETLKELENGIKLEGSSLRPQAIAATTATASRIQLMHQNGRTKSFVVSKAVDETPVEDAVAVMENTPKHDNLVKKEVVVEKDFINSMDIPPEMPPIIGGYNGNADSAGERRIDAFLGSYILLNGQNLTYSRRMTYPGLVGDPDGNGRRWPLLFDFFAEDNLLIEYDGEQHFRPSGYPNGAAAFERQQRYDQMKNNYCRDNGLHLIRISYSRTQEIITILTDVIGRWDAGLNQGEILAEFYGEEYQ
uniref:Peptidase A2 domain-containing protein n=1 Tax=Rhabditophanes sp. KR3021 TaxID=114890 RepID=A0AC35UDJ8_9BILA